jgi:uncharacterized membrane protein
MDELLVAHITVAGSVILSGLLSFLLKPDKPSKIMGYRTKRSMKSDAAWKFSNDKFAILMLWNSLVTLTIQIFTYFTMTGLASILITTGALTIGIGISFVLVDVQLKNNFDQEGEFKHQSRF